MAKFSTAYGARAECSEVMPVVYPGIMPVFPLKKNPVGSNSRKFYHPCCFYIRQVKGEYGRVGFRAHIFMSAAAGSAWACCPNQRHRIKARMLIRPLDSQLLFGPVGGNRSRD